MGAGRRNTEEKLGALKERRDALLARLHEAALKVAALETTLAERESGGEAARRALEAPASCRAASSPITST